MASVYSASGGSILVRGQKMRKMTSIAANSYRRWAEYSHSSPRVIGDEEFSLRMDPGEGKEGHLRWNWKFSGRGKKWANMRLKFWSWSTPFASPLWDSCIELMK